MNISEYDRYLEYNDNPYLGYLEQVEAAKDFGDLTDEETALCQIKELGYSVYKLGQLRESSFCYGLLLKEIREWHEEKGSLPILVYSDEDIAKPRRNPFFKPDFSPDTLESFFYIGGLFLLLEDESKRCTDEILNVSQYTEKAKAILDQYSEGKLSALHVSEILYHLNDTCDYKYGESLIKRDKGTVDKKVSAVILSKDNVKMLLECIDSLQKGCDVDMEYIVVDNGSSESNQSELSRQLEKRAVKYIYQPMEFSYSAMCNIGASEASGDFILFLNDDVVLPSDTKGFPSELMYHAIKPWAGAVGVRLIYPPDRNEGREILQHVGIAKLQVGPSHKLATFSDDAVYERGRNRGSWNVIAVTGACLLVERRKFEEVSGFSEEIKVAYTDVDLCLSLFEHGYLSICDNDIKLIHYESVSRGSDLKEKNRSLRLKEERNTFYRLHPYFNEGGDPFYNVNLTSIGLDYVPEFSLPWEEFDISRDLIEARAKEGKRVSTKLLPSGKLLGSVDRLDFVPSSFDNVPDYYEIEGWCIYPGRDQLAYNPVVVVVMDAGMKIYPAVFKRRSELKSVFPDEKNTGLSGLVCRISADEVCEGSRIGVGVTTRKLLRDCLCYYMMTDKKL